MLCNNLEYMHKDGGFSFKRCGLAASIEIPERVQA